MRNITLVAGAKFMHFKGNVYTIIAVATHTETAEVFVIYENASHQVFARPYDMFVSEVDHEKYPDATQKYRFEPYKPQADNED